MKRSAIAAILLSTAALGCSDDEPTQPPPPPSSHTIIVSPSSASVWVHMSQGFVATSSDTADHAVTWRLRRDPALSDTTDVGTIVATGPKSVTYTAPAKVEDALFGYTLTLQAVSTGDTTVRGATQIIVPPVKVAIVPNGAVNVLPAAELPFTILVGNTPNKGFTLEVDDFPGGNEHVGTFVMTGPATATYTAPVKDSADVYTLRARSTDDSRRFGIARVSVFPGLVPPGTDPSQNQWAPEWSTMAPRLAYVRGGGGTWQLVIHDFDTHSEQVLTTLAWSAPTYDGRIAWSETGGRLLFSEETSGRRTIGVIQDDGTGRMTFAPQAFTDYDEACFVPGSSDSIYVTQRNGVNWSLRAYRLGGLPGDVGRTLHAPAATVELHSPDATLFPSGPPRPHVAFETVVDGHGTVRSMTDDGAGRVGVAYSSATARTQQVRWAIPSDPGAFVKEWITFVHRQNNALYRVEPSGLSLPIQCYTDNFPEAASDLKVLPTYYFGFDNPLAITRLDSSGHWRIWVVEFPPSVIVMRPRVASLARSR